MLIMLQPENVCFPNPSHTAVDVLIPLLSDRTKRVKDARSEAQKEIEEYRKNKEEEFKKFEAEVCFSILLTFRSTKLTIVQHASGNKKAEEEANKDAEAKLKE